MKKRKIWEKIVEINEKKEKGYEEKIKMRERKVYKHWKEESENREMRQEKRQEGGENETGEKGEVIEGRKRTTQK